MKRWMILFGLGLCVMGRSVCGAQEAGEDWLARVRAACQEPPSRPRRVMLVFPLVEAGADIHAQNNDLWQPLHYAAYYAHVEVARFLLDKGAQADAQCVHGTPLHLAAKCGSKELVLLFLERGVDVNAVDHNGRTATGHAVKEGHHEIAELLRERGGVE